MTSLCCAVFFSQVCASVSVPLYYVGVTSANVCHSRGLSLLEHLLLCVKCAFLHLLRTRFGWVGMMSQFFVVFFNDFSDSAVGEFWIHGAYSLYDAIGLLT